MKNIIIYKFLLIALLTFNYNVFAKDFIIEGNQFTDNDILLSIIGEIPNTNDNDVSNYILKELNNSGLFKSVEVSYDENNYYLSVVEFSSINKFIFIDNERIKNEEIESIIKQLEIFTLSDVNINFLIDELIKIYQSFGYNNIQIEYKSEKFTNNSSDVYLTFNEGKITKIKSINITGNVNFDKNFILSKIKSKTKKISNIFANNNFKLYQIENDKIRILNFYKNQGYKDVKVSFNVEYYSNNKADINFAINEGKKYYFSKLNINNTLSPDVQLDNELKIFIENNSSIINDTYNIDRINKLEIDLSNILENFGILYYKINKLEKINNYKADVLLEILPTQTTYLNQINFSGNTRTYDYVLRRELAISEGDPINDSNVKQIKRDISRLPFVGNVDVNIFDIDENNKNIDIEIEEIQTGSFNVGLSVGTLDGASFVSGLRESNINGTGRTLEFLVNTNKDNKEFTLSTGDKFFLNSKINHKYSAKYKENDYSKSKSYKLNTFKADTSLNYLFSDRTYHKIGIGYSFKNYNITDVNSASSNILSSSGDSISFNILNDITRNTLNSFMRPTNGNYISFENFIETPSSSTNGFIKNILTGKKYHNINKNVFSIQAKAGNIYSLSNNEIVSDNKFSLGGRWLRGFDSFGAGPRNSRTSYVGGNNLLVTKLDLSRPISLSEQNPIFLNFFNDYGIVWENKNSVTSSDQSLRASYGVGINYYSPIGPIGFTWGFPLLEKEYDIKRMFLFSIGNLN